MRTEESEPFWTLFYYLCWNWLGIQTLYDCISHLPWVNKTSSFIISHHDHEWCYGIVIITFSLMPRWIFSVELDYISFSKYPFEKDYPGFWLVSKATREVPSGSHWHLWPLWFFPMGPDSWDRIGSTSSASHAVTAWTCWCIWKYLRCHAGLGTLPKKKIAVPLWYSAIQLAREKGGLLVREAWSQLKSSSRPWRFTSYFITVSAKLTLTTA